MDLLGVRTKAAKLSGRMDLVNPTTFADNGLDFFIQEGSRFLDRRLETKNSSASFFRDANIGDFHILLEDCRVVEEVYFYTADQRYQLEKCSKEKLRSFFPSVLVSSEKGIPRYYYPANLRLGGITPDTPVTGFLSKIELNADEFNGLIFGPLDTAGIFEISGKFYSSRLVEDLDENYWTKNHPMLLVWATLYLLEISYRNSEGAKDWLGALTNSLVELEMDFIDETSNDLKQLGGKENE